MDALHLLSSQQLHVYFLSSPSPSHSTCCGRLVGLSPEAFHSSYSLITHPHRRLLTHSSPSSSVYTQVSASFSMQQRSETREEKLCFGSGWLGYKAVLVLTVDWLVYCSPLPCSETLLWVFPSLCVNLQPHSGQIVENSWIKSRGESRKGMEMCCVQTTERHASWRSAPAAAANCSQSRLVPT